MPVLSSAIFAAMLLHKLPPSTGSPWDGIWKLNKASVHMIPPPLAIEKAGPHYTIKLGRTYRFECDGRDYGDQGSGSVRCSPLTHGIKVEMKRAGHLSNTWELNLHPDGITMTNTVTEFSPGIPPSIEHDEYRRSAPDPQSVAGSWTAVGTNFEGTDALELRIHNGSLYFRDARDGQASDSKLDGTPSPFLGAGASSGVTWSNVLESDRRIVGHAMKDAKQLNTDVFELSSDGKSIKASQPGSPNQFEAIYEKQ